MLPRILQGRRGFTLIELMAVIAILTALVSKNKNGYTVLGLVFKGKPS